MPLEVDDILGATYLAVQDFKDRAVVFGVQASLPATEAIMLAALAAASRAVDSFCGRTFTPDVLTETHRFDLRTRRVSVNQPPVQTLSSYKLIVGPGLSSQVQLAAIYINNQENYLELVSLSQVVVAVAEILTLGLTEVQAEVKYTSFEDVPKQVAAATGFTAGKILNEMYASAQVPDGFARVRVGGSNGLDMMRRPTTDDTELLPPVAKMMLAPLRRIAVG